MTAPGTAAGWIRALGLTPHPEGGHYRETYRAATLVSPPGFPGPRAASTAIYFLLADAELSTLHRLRADELWLFHTGAALRVVVLGEDGAAAEHRLGLDLAAGQIPQLVVAAGAWFGARVAGGTGFALVSCVVAPGFDFADFQLGDRAALRAQYRQHAGLVDAFTRA